MLSCRPRPAAAGKAGCWRSGLASCCGGAVGIDSSRSVELQQCRLSPRRSQASRNAPSKPQPKPRAGQHNDSQLPGLPFTLLFSLRVPLGPAMTLPSLGALATPHKPSSQLSQVGPSSSSCWAHSSCVSWD